MSLEEISDRLEIAELINAYSHAIDTRAWDELDDVFTEDAVIDYTEMGGPRGDRAEIKAFLTSTMPIFKGFQHMQATTRLLLDGDSATGRTICHNPMILATPDGRTKVLYCGLWYRDTFVRTAAGWRISERYEEKCYSDFDA
jgi:ketosteroid isomerase-like protein